VTRWSLAKTSFPRRRESSGSLIPVAAGSLGSRLRGSDEKQFNQMLRYWIVQDPARRNVTRLLPLNGIAILGGLLLVLESVRG